jgi:hypothetical protein
MRATRKAALILAIGMLLPAAGEALAAERAPVVTTPHFAFYSDFDTNLNDALIAAGLARKGGKDELFRAGGEVACFEKLAPSVRAGWNGAVTYYAEIISPADWIARQQYLIRMHLAGFDEELKDDAARQFVDIAQSFRAAATPAYKACRWTAQDEQNRLRITELKALLAAHEEKIAPRLERLYQKRWTRLPVHVDIVETVNWSGANSAWSTAGDGHLLMSTSYQGNNALEIVFHEASHILMDRSAPLRQALDSAPRAADAQVPGDLWHLVLFYTTGHTVRRVLEEAGQPGYATILSEILDRGGPWTPYREPLERTWRPYIDGERTLAEAAASLMAALRKAP